MDKKKEEEAKKRLEEMKKKAKEEDVEQTDTKEPTQEIPRDAFRKNLGCGG